MRAVFVDTSFLLAASNPRDAWYEAARAAARTSSSLKVTTDAVLLEYADAMSGKRSRSAAAETIVDLLRDPSVECVPVTRELFERALALYRGRADKDWGLTDCVSFVVMKDRDLDEALTSDRHFEQMGFRALLRGE